MAIISYLSLFYIFRKRQQGTGWRHLEMTEVPPRFARLMEEEKSKEEEEIKSRIFIGKTIQKP